MCYGLFVYAFINISGEQDPINGPIFRQKDIAASFECMQLNDDHLDEISGTCNYLAV